MTATQRFLHGATAALDRGAWAGTFARAPAVLAVTALAVWAVGFAATATAATWEAIVVDARSGEVVFQDNADTVTHPASLTKMMTLYLAFDALDEGRLKLDQSLPVSEFAQGMAPTKLGLRAGNTIKVETAILGLVTKSANDAAVVLAEALGGSEARFAEMMTHKAHDLGMRHTLFRNASGLPDDEQVTTARDFSILARALIVDHPEQYPYFSRRSFVYGGRPVHNHNHLMERYAGMDGIKTGYIKASGFNLAASVVRGGRRLVAVVMGGKSARSRDDRMEVILNNAFAQAGPRRRDPDQPVIASVGEPPSVQMASLDLDERPTPVPSKPPVHKASRANGGETWGVQVGAYASRSAGTKAMTQVSSQLSRLVGDAKPSVVAVATRKGTVYRVRLVGLDEKAARNACAKLQKTGGHCVPIAPGSGA